MKHSIVFDNAQSDWNEALPLGNGTMGSMTFFRDHRLETAYNHYEVYYSHYQRYSQQYAENLAKGTLSIPYAESTYQSLIKQAEDAYRDYTKEPIVPYRDIVFPQSLLPRKATMYSGSSHPPTAEMTLVLGNEQKNPDSYSLALNIEDATVQFSCQTKQETVTITDRILVDWSAGVKEVHQTQFGMIDQLILRYPQRRNHEGFQYEWTQTDDSTFLCQVSFYPKGEDASRFPPFRFVTVTKLVHASGKATVQDNEMTIPLTQAESKFYIITHVLTCLQADNLASTAQKQVEEIAAELKASKHLHASHWTEFFSKSRISIPDKFLERLWYLNLYILGCSSGKDGKRKEQASGLNGLWDIRQPSLWGSLWYWDVNIQATYWPVYTANHLDLAQVFHEGLVSYLPMGKKMAQDFYGMKGCAIDYPHTFYNCIWPWSAQFLWWYYEYTLDKDFLRSTAYPLFLELITFIAEVCHYDAQKEEYYFFPDVSPEQGPLTRNSTITLSTVKYLLEFTLQSNKILGESSEDYRTIENLLNKLPAYPKETIPIFGEIIKDSEHANPYSQLRHPSLLMPIFPIGEITQHSPPEMTTLARNTVAYADENSEIGVFIFGWVSCAASRMGMGNTALRVLYEKGLDLLLRSNGMGAEQTDRWINYCATSNQRPPLYHPFMMECVGEIVASVNEMLLQSNQGIIEVFPALPTEAPEPAHEMLQSLQLNRHANQRYPKRYPAWGDCSFENLRARGAFLVSACSKKGITQWITIQSLQGASCRLRNDYAQPAVLSLPDYQPIPFQQKEGIILFETEPSISYLIIEQETSVTPSFPENKKEPIPCFYRNHLGRHVFAGKDRNTDTIKRIDDFLYDYYNGNVQYNITTPYRFRFGEIVAEDPAPSQESYQLEKAVEDSLLTIDATVDYTTKRGFGFLSTDNLWTQRQDHSHALLRDFITATEDHTFAVELTKGEYHLLFVVGDAEDSAGLQVTTKEQSLQIRTKAGEYRAEVLPLVISADDVIHLHLHRLDDKPWKLNGIIIKQITAYL